MSAAFSCLSCPLGITPVSLKPVAGEAIDHRFRPWLHLNLSAANLSAEISLIILIRITIALETRRGRSMLLVIPDVPFRVASSAFIA
jgi:hypothetical protein